MTNPSISLFISYFLKFPNSYTHCVPPKYGNKLPKTLAMDSANEGYCHGESWSGTGLEFGSGSGSGSLISAYDVYDMCPRPFFVALPCPCVLSFLGSWRTLFCQGICFCFSLFHFPFPTYFSYTRSAFFSVCWVFVILQLLYYFKPHKELINFHT